jgi:hypothetical protein
VIWLFYAIDYKNFNSRQVGISVICPVTQRDIRFSVKKSILVLIFPALNYKQSNTISMAMPLKSNSEGVPQPHTQWVAEFLDRVNIAKAEIERGEGLDGETVVNGIIDRFRKAKGYLS